MKERGVITQELLPLYTQCRNTWNCQASFYSSGLINLFCGGRSCFKPPSECTAWAREKHQSAGCANLNDQKLQRTFHCKKRHSTSYVTLQVSGGESIERYYNKGVSIMTQWKRRIGDWIQFRGVTKVYTRNNGQTEMLVQNTSLCIEPNLSWQQTYLLFDIEIKSNSLKKQRNVNF